MQFGSAVTEYLLPGIPVTAVLASELNRLRPDLAKRLIATGSGHVEVAFAAILVLAAAYMIGVMVHCFAKRLVRSMEWRVEESIWRDYGSYCGYKLGLLGRNVPRELRDHGPGWVMLRMRYFLCHRSPECAAQIEKLQAVSRAARASFGIPVAVLMWVAAQAARPAHGTSPLVVVGAFGLAVAFGAVVFLAYRSRWAVVCRGTIAAFLS